MYMYVYVYVYSGLPQAANTESLRFVALFPFTAAVSPTPVNSITQSTQTETPSDLLASPPHIQATQLQGK